MGIKRERNPDGTFSQKQDHRKVRSFRSTDQVWDQLKALADQRGQTPADLIEWAVLSGRLSDLQPTDPQPAQLPDLDAIKHELLADPTITRKGKDGSACRRAIDAFIHVLQRL